MNRFLILLLLSFVSLHPPTAYSQSGARWYYNIDSSNVAVQGFDLVSYHSKGAVKGKPEITTEFKGITYHFNSKKNKDIFDKNPEKYLPAFGGWCTFFMGIDKEKTGFAPTRMPVDPEAFKIIDGKLYLFLNTPKRNYLEAFERSESQTATLNRAEDFWNSRENLAALYEGLPQGLNPNARMELLQWQVFMGSWEVDLKWWTDTTGTAISPSKGRWKFYYGYEGYCIQDDFRSKQDVPYSGTVNGPAIRGYDPVKEEWHMTYIPVNQSRDATWLMTGNFLRKGYLEGMLKTKDSFGNPVMQKVIFDLQSPDKFTWRGHWSWDDGKTWKENVGYGECTKSGTNP